ncbi:MAG: MerC domain-containing protein [Acidobacteria bacterium]|nr:MerC domain-containing protein [Acidobacteriota bacterium]
MHRPARPEVIRLDLVGFSASFLCAIHCAALPLLLSILPSLGLAWIGSHYFGYGMVAFSAFMAWLALRRGLGIHNQWWPIVLSVVGFSALVIGEVLLEDFESVHPWVMASGGFIVAGSHVLNQYFCKTCHTCENH